MSEDSYILNIKKNSRENSVYYKIDMSKTLCLVFFLMKKDISFPYFEIQTIRS